MPSITCTRCGKRFEAEGDCVCPGCGALNRRDPSGGETTRRVQRAALVASVVFWVVVIAVTAVMTLRLVQGG